MKLYKRNREIADDEKIKIEKKVLEREVYEHKHEFIEIVYILSGRATHKIDDMEYSASHGDLLFINYGQTHSFKPEDDVTYVEILFTPEFLSAELIGYDDITVLLEHSMFVEFAGVSEYKKQCVHFSRNERTEIDNIIQMMIDEYLKKSIGYKSALHGYVKILFVMMLRKLYEKNEKSMNNVISDALDYIDENISNKILLSDIAAKSFYNPVYFSRLLKRYCGKTFSSYLKEKRMNRAGQLLKTTNQSVESVMTECGYTDKKLFYNHFKEAYNMLPKEYRKK